MKQMNEKRRDMGLFTTKQVLHMIFTGNPGTGKTSIARELAKILYRLNILSRGHFIEVERADIVGEYIGQTAQKTKAIFQKALGGVLFIDEAYALARGGKRFRPRSNRYDCQTDGRPFRRCCFNISGI